MNSSFYRRRMLLALVCIVLLSTAGFFYISTKAQAGLWQNVSTNAMVSLPGLRWVTPQTYRGLRVDPAALLNVLLKAPQEGTGGPEVRLPIPMPQGGSVDFRIEESPIMESGLARQFPGIKTFSGRAVNGSGLYGRFDWTESGFHGIVFTAEGTIYIDPYLRGSSDYYVSYFKRDLRKQDTNWDCLTDETMSASPATRLALPNISSGPTLRTYRAAVATTGEYALFHGGTTGGALSAIVTTMNRVNGVYEREVGVRMVLINAQASIIFLDPATDPYTNNSGGTMLGQNQTTLDTIIGAANYDIGHVFSTGGGGVASLRSVCVTGSKARGVTGSPSPVGDGFDIDYVAHEMGHQFGGNHTFNGTTSACSGNRAASAAYEPGSGTTIMAYAGICAAENLQPNSDDYFHIKSLEEILAFITTGSGASCPVPTGSGNQPPTVSAGISYTIPANTPFSLTASGTDPDGDLLTWCWEQYDLGAASPPNTDNGTRPIFRSFKGTSDPTRTFPRLSDILNNTATLGESLPTTTRSLNFRVTARDNRLGGGGVADAAVLISTRSDAGPFAITAPNTAVTWTGGDTATVSWNVANTNLAPINTANVRIVLSTDGGQSFPIQLLASTANDGSETINVPTGITTSTARVKVEAIGNIYFDISNVNFSITPGAGGCAYSINPTSQNFTAAGGSSSIAVTTTAGCAWTATTTDSWISITAGSSGSGSGSVSYSVAANISPARTGTIQVAGQTFTITQAGGCTYGINPVSQNYGSAGGTGSVAVTTGAGCAWSAASNAGWIQITSGASGAGNGSVSYSVVANTGAARTGTMTVAGQPFTVNQAGVAGTARAKKSDFDGDGKTDFAAWRGSNGNWLILQSTNNQLQTTPWGSALAPYNDIPVPGDYDGDGKTDLAVWRPSDGYWYIIRSSDSQYQFTSWGAGYAPYNDVPVPGDYDGDGKTDIAVWRKSNGDWYIIQSSNNQIRSVNWGNAAAPTNDTPVQADYDGDGKTDLAVWRESDGTWRIIKSSNSQTQITPWGSSLSPINDRAVPGDYDGDGKADIAVWRQPNGFWYIIQSSNGQTASVNWGSGVAPYNDVAVPGDYDGDGKTDIAVWRPSAGAWYVIRSSNGSILSATNGQSGDLPIPSIER